MMQIPPDSEMLVTMTIGIGRNGDIHQDTVTHGNKWADVYRGMHAIKDKIAQMIEDRRVCPFNPRNLPNG